MRTKQKSVFKEYFVSICAFLGFLVFFIYGIYSVQTGIADKNLENIEQAIRRGTIQCYAIEGIYPKDLEYLKKEYGIIVDEKKYSIIYTAYASNVMPEIEVYTKG